jgi:hypothetical protein
VSDEAVTPADASESQPEGVERSLRTAATLTAVVGAAHAILFIASFWLLSALPPEDATSEEIRSFYSDESSRRVLLVGVYLVPFAGMAFVWFVVALRMWIDASRASRRSLLQSNLQLVSGIIYIAMLFAGGAAFAVIGASVEWGGSDVDPAAAREFPVYGQLLFVFALRIGAMFVITTCSIGSRARILPRWFALSGYAVGVLLLVSPSFQRGLVLVFPIWLLALSLILIHRARRIDPDARLAPEPVRGGLLARSQRTDTTGRETRETDRGTGSGPAPGDAGSSPG